MSSQSSAKTSDKSSNFTIPQDFSECLFNREKFATSLTNAIEAERPFVSGSLVLTLNGQLGSGKSTFFEMWQKKIRQEKIIMRHTSDDIPNVIYLSAWESDYIGDPLIALIVQITDLLDEAKMEAGKQLKLLAEALGKTFGSMANDALKKATSIDANKAFNTGKSVEAPAAHNLIDEFNTRKSALDKIIKILTDNALGENQSPLLIIVDELDRCRPDYAIDFLETIKHVFDIPGIVFVLGVDLQALESTTRCVFGSDMDFERYYRKFSHRTATLPMNLASTQPSQTYNKLTLDYIDKYLLPRIDTSLAKDLNHYLPKIIPNLIELFKLTPRDTQEVFRILSHTISCKEYTRTAGGLIKLTSIFSALKISHPKTFEKLKELSLTTPTAIRPIGDTIKELNLSIIKSETLIPLAIGMSQEKGIQDAILRRVIPLNAGITVHTFEELFGDFDGSPVTFVCESIDSIDRIFK